MFTMLKSVVCHRVSRLISWRTPLGESTFARNDHNFVHGTKRCMARCTLFEETSNFFSFFCLKHNPRTFKRLSRKVQKEFNLRSHKGSIRGGGGYSHTLPIRVCAAQRDRDFEAPDLERGIIFRVQGGRIFYF